MSDLIKREDAIEALSEPSGNLISREKLNECIKRWYEYMGVDLHGVFNKQLAEIVKRKDEDDLALDFRFLFTSISALPSVDAVEVVRCKDCRYFTHYADGCGVCTEKDNILTYQNQNDFCSYGERRKP